MTRPHYVTTTYGQLRLWTHGRGPALVALAGPVRAASTLATELAGRFPDRSVVVVEPPGIGGSSRLPFTSAADAAERVADALEFLAGEQVDLVAAELSAALVPGLGTRLKLGRCVLLDSASARGWVEQHVAPPDPTSTTDGAHLTALWTFLRDRRLLCADDPTLPRDSGDPPPTAAELDDAFVAAATDPAAFGRYWSAAAGGLAPALADPSTVRVETVAELVGVLAAAAGEEAPEAHATAAAADGEIWHQYLDTAAGRVHLRRCGSAGRPVLVLSTGGGSSAQFAPVLRGLARSRTAVAMDYLGNGLSDKPDSPADVATLAVEAFAVADALGWDEFDVWGSHTGACVGLEMAVLAPERIGRAVLEAPVVASPQFRDDLLAHYFPDLAPDAFGLHVQRAWHWRRDAFAYWPWYRVEHAAARAIGIPDADELQHYAVGILESGATYARAYRTAFAYDTLARLPHLRRPAILTAGPHDMLANALDDAADLVPDGLLRTVPTPATVWWPDPEPAAADETMRIYREFLG